MVRYNPQHGPQLPAFLTAVLITYQQTSYAHPMTATRPRALLPTIVLAAIIACVLYAASGLWTDIAAAGADILQALWTVPLIIGLHGVQLLLSAFGWSRLLVPTQISPAALFCIRLIREGVNSLLPVAHVGGEVVATRLLAQRTVPVTQAAASVITDVTMEVCSQFVFLLAGLLALGDLSGAAPAWLWAGSVATAALIASSLLLAQRYGALRLLEAAVQAIGRRWPALSGFSLEGLTAQVEAIYRRPVRLGVAFLAQFTAWNLGVLETWLVLHALGLDPTPAQAFVVESLGAAARSAGFAVPGALAIQETGFVLAAAAVGLPELPALSLSLIKRVREVLVGLAGLLCWRLMRRAHHSTAIR